jgi:hypothetical protein
MVPTDKAPQRLQAIDAVLYLVAGSAMVIISVTFLLWLRY